MSRAVQKIYEAQRVAHSWTTASKRRFQVSAESRDAGEPGSPLADVTTAYRDFFELFCAFEEFGDFFHCQDFVTPDYENVEFFLPPYDRYEQFKRSGTPATTRVRAVGRRWSSSKTVTPDGRVGHEAPSRH